MMRHLLLAGALAAAVLLQGCGYDALQRSDEQVKAAWVEVADRYQRRAELIPDLVNTVTGFDVREQQALVGVTRARARVGTIPATPELINDPQAFTRFQQAQGELSSALSRLLVAVERYPALKSDESFRGLQERLQGAENRIEAARDRYVQAVQEYNLIVRRFPTNLTALLSGFRERPQFTIGNQKDIITAPRAGFGAPSLQPPG
jgi:LemA protein